MGGSETRWKLGEQDLDALLRESKQYKGESLWNDASRRLRRNRAAYWSLLFLALFGVVALFAPFLPLPSPKAMDHSTINAQPPEWPWTRPRVAAEWDPATDEEEDKERKDRDIGPGVLPTSAFANLWNDGWRHRAIVHFHVETQTGATEAITAFVREATGRKPRVETRPDAEGAGWDTYLSIPLRTADVPRTDEVSTGSDTRGELDVWRYALPPDPGADADAPVAYAVAYELSVPRDLGPLARWAVEQRTRRGKLLLTPTEHDPGIAGFVYTFKLGERPAGEPGILVVNGRAYDLEGNPAELPAGPKIDPQESRARELERVPHYDLRTRMAESLAESPIPGAELVKVQIEDGYWELNAMDRGLLRLRATVFGSRQTGNWMGTDEAGRDLLSRIVWGSRTSILVALAAAACSLIIGVVYGALSGLLGGRIDNFMMRIVDMLYSVPFIFVVIFLITIVNEYRTELEDSYGIDREVIFYVVIGAIYWLTMARVVRGQVLSLKNSEFIEAARVTGASTRRILFAHLVPNVLSIVIVGGTSVNVIWLPASVRIMRICASGDGSGGGAIAVQRLPITYGALRLPCSKASSTWSPMFGMK